MDYENKESKSSEESERTSGEHKPLKDTFRSGSPEEVRDKVKDTVAKGVAAVAGALRGFSETTKNEDVAGRAKEAIGSAGETASSTISSVAEQAKGLKEPLKDAGQKLSETARDLKDTAKEQYSSTKDAVKGSSSERSGSLGSSSLTGSSYGDISGSSSDMARSGGQGSELPDISRTPLAASDKELKGKDLTEDLED